MTDKDLVYAEYQMLLQKEKVANITARFNKKTEQLSLWDAALKGISEQREECRLELDGIKTELRDEQRELARREKHFHVLRNQHKSVKANKNG